MLTSRTALRSMTSSKRLGSVRSPARWLSSKAPVAKKEEEDEGALSPVAEKLQALRKKDPYQITGPVSEKAYEIAYPVPENPAEMAMIDPADLGHRTQMDGTKRTVIIRQDEKSARQAPLNPESLWRIAMYEDGIYEESQWKNELMGWTSSSDPYQCEVPLEFSNAAEAVHFAKKRGWDYVVKEPFMRPQRDDDAQYQDNFLPQLIANRVLAEGTGCRHWERKSAGTSHYFRPLKYHGDGTVRQHGPNREAESAKAPEGYYKMR